MSAVINGHCLCGNVEFEYSGLVGAANYCHCEDCRRSTGSAFNIGVPLETSGFKIVHGQPKGFTNQGESGNKLTRHFCPDCGSPIFTSSALHPEYVYVKAGIFNDPALVKPVHQSWVSSAVSWHRITNDLMSFTKGPSRP